MDISLILGISIVVGCVIVVIFWMFKNQKPAKSDNVMSLLQQQVDNLRQQVSESLNANAQLVNQRLSELNNSVNQNLQAVTEQMIASQKTVGDRLEGATHMVGQVQKGLGSLTEATQRIFEVGKDIASLQEILQAPKIRGGLGELFLEDLLKQMLPFANFQMQYKFKSGVIVDSVVRLGEHLISVDSKFPLENFRRIISSENEDGKKQARRIFKSDVKKHIDSIASKYIVPDEGTFDFALMYIPAENVYYEMIIKDDGDGENSLSVYALKKKVIPVSPNSFYAYLNAIVLGLKGLKIEKNVQNIIQHLDHLNKDMERFKNDFEVLGTHIRNLSGKYDEADKRLSKFEGKLVSICQVENDNKLLGDHE
ncbi:MAG: DNA recombination protein RmuC [Candidatus Omnitrophota bacterium]